MSCFGNWKCYGEVRDFGFVIVWVVGSGQAGWKEYVFCCVVSYGGIFISISLTNYSYRHGELKEFCQPGPRIQLQAPETKSRSNHQPQEMESACTENA